MVAPWNGRAIAVVIDKASTGLEAALDWGRDSGLQIALLALGAVLLGRWVGWISTRVTRGIDERSDNSDALVRSESSKHRHVLTQAASWTSVVLIYLAAGLLILQRLGLPLAGFVAPATVAGVAIGFGAQRLVQDVLAGFFVIAERQYGFGDLVRVSVIGVAIPVLGTVEDVSLRITTVRTPSGEVVITPNGQIVQVTNLSRDWARAVIDIPFPASADVTRVSAILKHVGLDAFTDSTLRPLLLDAPTVMGVESLEVDQFKIRLVSRTLPGKQFEVGRALRARIAVALLREGIVLATELDTAMPTSGA